MLAIDYYFQRKGDIVRTYELTVIVRINSDLESNIAKVKDILQKHGALIENDQSWGSRRMAYEINGEREAHYLLLLIQTPADSVAKIIAEFKLNQNILRYLFVVMPQKKIA